MLPLGDVQEEQDADEAARSDEELGHQLSVHDKLQEKEPEEINATQNDDTVKQHLEVEQQCQVHREAKEEKEESTYQKGALGRQVGKELQVGLELLEDEHLPEPPVRDEVGIVEDEAEDQDDDQRRQMEIFSSRIKDNEYRQDQEELDMACDPALKVENEHACR